MTGQPSRAASLPLNNPNVHYPAAAQLETISLIQIVIDYPLLCQRPIWLDALPARIDKAMRLGSIVGPDPAACRAEAGLLVIDRVKLFAANLAVKYKLARRNIEP